MREISPDSRAQAGRGRERGRAIGRRLRLRDHGGGALDQTPRRLRPTIGLSVENRWAGAAPAAASNRRPPPFAVDLLGSENSD